MKSDFVILDRESIDEQAWNKRCKHLHAPFYNHLHFLDALSPGWKILSNSNGDFFFPLTIKRKLGIPYLVQPAFCQQLWFLVSDEGETGFESRALHYLSRKFKHINIQIGGLIDPELSGFKIVEQLNYVLARPANDETLWNSYSNNLKRNIKKARGLELDFMQLGLEETMTLFIKRTLREKDISVITERHLKSLSQFLKESAELKVLCLGVGSKGSVLSSACFVICHGRAYYLLSANSKEAKSTGASAYLIDLFLRSEFGKQINALDFEGSSMPGLGRFYKSFGAVAEKYYHLRRSALKRKG